MKARHVRRGGEYLRVCKPDWSDCADTSYAKLHGGRWNPPAEFGALYLCASVEVAAAVARTSHAGRALSLLSLRPERRPSLQRFEVTSALFVDAVTPQGVRSLGLPPGFPLAVGWTPCQNIARRSYARGDNGVASRSASECGPHDWVGEELAVFDRAPQPPRRGAPIPFSRWYREPIG